MKFNMYEFALMGRFIELGKRYGLEPWEFGVEYDRSTGVTYFTGTPAGAEESARFDRMAACLGVGEKDSIIPIQEGADMLDALDDAIRNAPKIWTR